MIGDSLEHGVFGILRVVSGALFVIPAGSSPNGKFRHRPIRDTVPNAFRCSWSLMGR